MKGSLSAGVEGKDCKFVLYSVFDEEPVPGLQSGVGVTSGAGSNDNFGESMLDTLNTCYIVLGRSIENGMCIV